jgi:hypothetical protein
VSHPHFFLGLQRYNFFRENLQSQTKKFTNLKTFLLTLDVNNFKCIIDQCFSNGVARNLQVQNPGLDRHFFRMSATGCFLSRFTSGFGHAAPSPSCHAFGEKATKNSQILWIVNKFLIILPQRQFDQR